MPYVIQSITNWNKKDGTPAEMIYYFRENNNRIFTFNSMVTKPSEAKQYEFKSEAQREKRLYFRGQKQVKIIKV